MLVQKKTKKNAGFTLIETLLYIGLFGLILSGTILSIYPIFTNTQRSMETVVAEGEAAFLVQKINTALLSASSFVVPFGDDELRVILHGGAVVWFRQGSEQLEISRDYGTTWTPLNTSRIPVENFLVTETMPSGDAPRYIEFTFDVDGRAVGPIRKIFHF